MLLQHLEKLDHFLAVAKEGSFLAGANSRGVAQPTLMYSVKKLEEVLGRRLFYRSRQGTTLTPTGRELLKFTNRLNNLVQEFETESLELKPKNQLIRLASHNLFLNSVIIPQLKEITLKTPLRQFVLQTDPSSSRLIRWLQEGKTDIAIVAETKAPEDIKLIGLIEEQYRFYCSPQLIKKFSRKKLDLNSIGDFNVFYVPQAVAGKELPLSRVIWEKKISLNSRSEFSDFETVKAMAENGYGLGILPRGMILNEIQSGRLKEVPAQSNLKTLAKIKVQIAVRKDLQLPEITQAIKIKIKDYYQS